MPDSNQLHVAFYLRMLWGGGAERIFLNLIQGLLDRNIQVDLVLNVAQGPYLNQLPPQVNVIELGTSHLWKGLPKLVQYLKEKKPHCLVSALHFTNEIAIIARLLSRSTTKIIVTEHNTLSIHSRNQDDRERFAPLFSRFLYPLADKIVAVSHEVANDLSQVAQIERSRIKVIYNPVITSNLYLKSQETVDHPWLVDSNIPVIVAVGRLSQQKDYPTLIQGFYQARQEVECRLMILGSGSDRAKLQSLIKQLHLQRDVLFCGFKKNPYAYMAKASMLVLSSQWEGLPTVLIESLAVGTPIISTDCPSGPREILNQGTYGHLVPVGDSQMIGQKIIEVLNGNVKPVDPTWLEQFRLEPVTQKYIDLFMQL